MHFFLQLFFSIESGVQWPELSSCEAELGPGGEVIVRSEDKRAMLALSPSGEDFCVEFTCSLSQPQNQHDRTMRGSRKKDPNSSRSYPPQIISAAQDKVRPCNICMLISQVLQQVYLSSAWTDVSVHHSHPASFLLCCCPHMGLPSLLGSASLDDSSPST